MVQVEYRIAGASEGVSQVPAGTLKGKKKSVYMRVGSYGSLTNVASAVQAECTIAVAGFNRYSENRNVGTV